MQREDAAMVHEGRNVKRIREMLGVKQEALAMDLGITQQAVSQLEQKEALDKEMLEKVANALKVSPEAIKSFSEDNVINIFSNTYSDHASSIYNNFNPLERYVEQVEENKKLYEALLKSEREKIALLERMLSDKK
jgi:transcriptional regulator with XRE-family HTH domain